MVNWNNGNRFEVSFTKNNKSYELSKFHIFLNATDVIKDTSGKNNNF